MIRYGVHAGTEGASFEECLEFWQRVEALGYEWISVWDHFYPLVGSSSGPGSFDAVVSHAALASVTKKARVGVLCTRWATAIRPCWPTPSPRSITSPAAGPR